VIAALVSALHVFGVALGLGSVFARGRALRGTLDDAGLRRLFTADAAWGIAALVLLASGVARAFAGLEKGTAFYLASHMFWLKMTLFVVIVLLEIWPMATFIRWRAVVARGGRPDVSRARALYLVTHVEMALAALMVVVAALMARGFGAR
jgi:putative membrane protein